MNLYARKVIDKYQTLDEHLTNVAFLAENFAMNIGLGTLAKLSGLFHDIGKATAEFQNYLKFDGKKGSVAHSPHGAMFCFFKDNNSMPQLIREILAMVIVAHHNHLDDGCAIDGIKIFFEKMMNYKTNLDLSYDEVLISFNDSNMDNLFREANNELMRIKNRISSIYTIKQSAYFAIGLVVKYIYSCLIDADRLDAYLFTINAEYQYTIPKWQNLIDIFENEIATKFLCDTKIDIIRNNISNKCKEAANRPTGIYQLSVPTGGGKTLASLRFALHHCSKLSKKRIIYVIPYLSIIEQTAGAFRKFLDLDLSSDIILEHHSNIIVDEADDELRKITTARWDSAIIITTMVQFLETTMSSRASNLRKFHNMSDAVIIFDEIQSLPLKTIHLFNEVVTFLSKICNSTILLCTATQPLLEKTTRKNLMLSDNPNLIDDIEYAFEELKRTKIIIETEKDSEELAAFILQKAAEKQNCLAIFNTKKTAKEIYEKIKNLNINSDFQLYFLSTSMCPAHRFDVIKDITTELKNNQKIICISTQLIEAGVDLSFNCVVRSMAGLDSIAQAAGRCNRHGENSQAQNVYVVPLKGENLDKLSDIKVGKEVTMRLIRENPNSDFLNKNIMEQFYKYYFFEREKLMDYPTDVGQAIYGMISTNIIGMENFRNINNKNFPLLISHAFNSADNNFSVIEKNCETVIVLYKDAEKLIEEYLKYPLDIITKEKIILIKKLTKYSVSLFPKEFKGLTEIGAITLLDNKSGIKILNDVYYSKRMGVNHNIPMPDLVF